MPTVVVALVTWGRHAEAARIAAGKPPVDWGRVVASGAYLFKREEDGVSGGGRQE
jgi:hypothetical protein